MALEPIGVGEVFWHYSYISGDYAAIPAAIDPFVTIIKWKENKIARISMVSV